MTANSKLIFILERQKLTIASSLHQAPLVLDFPANIVSDIDIIDPESFDNLLVNFLNQFQIVKSDVILVINNSVYYDKDIILSVDATERQKQIDIFLDTIPFKHLFYKDYLIGQKGRLIALNKMFYEPLIKFFEKNVFNITAIIPDFILDNFQLPLKEFTPIEVKNIFQKYKLLEPFSLISTQDIDKIATSIIHHQKEDNHRAYLLLGVFCLLFVILLGFIYVVPRFRKPVVTQIAVPTLRPTPTDILVTPTLTAEILPTDLKIKVVNSSGITAQASKIKQSLSDIGFANISTFSSSTVISTKNQIIFSPLVSTELRQKITTAVTGLAGAVSTTDSSELGDINVLITTTAISPK